MICEKCGAVLPEGSRFCPACGAPLGDAPEGEAPSAVAEEAPAVTEEAARPAESEVPSVESEAPADGNETQPAESEVPPVPEDGEALPAADREAAAPEEAPAPEPPPRKKRRWPIVALAAAVVVAVVAAVALCAHFTGQSADPTEKVLELVECLPENETDVALETIGVPGDTVLLTANGQDITAEEYLYWLGNITSYYDMMSLYSGTSMDLTQEIQDGKTLDEQLKLAARDNAILLALTPELAKEYGTELTDEDYQMVVDTRAESIESVGGEAMYAYQLQAMGINDATALRLDAATALYSKLQETWVGQEAEKLTAADMAAYAEENDLLRAKHILLLTRDMTTGEALSEEEIAQKRAKADDLLAQLRADPDKFDEFMNANSEDTGLESYPDGYLFTAGDMVAEFEEGTRALAVGEISGVIESDYGYHIILRLDPDCDESRQEAAEARFSEMAQALVDGAEVVEHSAYGSFTTADYYGKLTAFQEALPQPETEPEAADQSQAELEPDAQAAP